MKFSESWLRERVNLDNITTEDLLHRFTMAGLEIESIEPATSADLHHIVVAKVDSVENHPDSKKLKICRVDIGQEVLTIVCGDPNVQSNSKVVAALPGAKIGTKDIVVAHIANVESHGMLCSEQELGLSESSTGIMQLSDDAQIGVDFAQYMQLNDQIIEMDLTPNRGDCLSVEGISRDAAALCGRDFVPLNIPVVEPQQEDRFKVELKAGAECPHYAGRVIRNIDNTIPTPLWIKERLRRSGIRSIDAVVDITNYVMIEIGQPLHAFDYDKLVDKIIVRKANSKEKITLLDGQELELEDDVLVIADASRVLAMAGIMGGLDSGVSRETKDIFLESAFFTPHLIAGKARRYGLHTDSSHRFERGVDINLQTVAIERATQLLLDVVGGIAGAVSEEEVAEYKPQPKSIFLRKARIEKILGCAILDDKVEEILQRLGMTILAGNAGWQVDIPSFRFDISIEVDLIEEIGRVYGYDQIPTQKIKAECQVACQPENKLTLRQLRNTLVDRDYGEIITYSFVDPKIQSLFTTGASGYRLLNPISEELSEMRQSLIPGLISTWMYNKNRQQNRIRLFETGLCFNVNNHELSQDFRIGGIASGALFNDQWGVKNRGIDFFDVKADLESIISLTKDCSKIKFVPWSDSSILHPGQAAKIVRSGDEIGYFGALHPLIAQQLQISEPIFIFEFIFNELVPAILPKFATLSKYPAIRRDISVVIDEQIPAEELCKTIYQNASEILVDLKIFDVYQGDKLKMGQKSIAFGLLLQHQERTLIDDEVNQLIDKVLSSLENQFKAVLRT